MFLFVIVLVVIVVAVIHFSKEDSSQSHSGSKETRYSKTGNFMDFDPGVDSDKVGDPKYPNAGTDSVMKHEFMNDLMKDDK